MNNQNTQISNSGNRNGNGAHLALHEVTDVDAKLIGYAGLWLIITGAIIQIGLGMTFLSLRRNYAQIPPHTIAAALLKDRQMPPEPRLQVDPPRDLALYLGRQNELLSTYGWTNERLHVARIPIKRAMMIVAARGNNLNISLPKPKAERKKR